MCGVSSEYGETRTWCGTGWVGQPAVFERDGRTWVVFGAYDYQFHFLDAATGHADPAAVPDRRHRQGHGDRRPGRVPARVRRLAGQQAARAGDRPSGEPVELWALDSTDPALQPRLWNSDWDAAPLIVGDYLVTGGENSRFHVVRLNRCYGPDGLVQVAPELVFTAPAWDDELLANLPDDRVSVENAVTLVGDTAYFTTSGGLVQGWDLSSLRTGQGEITRTFRFWTGDDTDATIVADEQGYPLRRSGVGPPQRPGARGRPAAQARSAQARQPGRVVDRRPGRRASAGRGRRRRCIATLIIWPTYLGPMYGIDRATGAVRWTIELPWAVMSSPVVVDDVLMQADATGRGPRLGPHGAAARRARCGRSSCRPTSSRRRRCGRAGSTWAPATGTSTPWATADAVLSVAIASQRSIPGRSAPAYDPVVT